MTVAQGRIAVEAGCSTTVPHHMPLNGFARQQRTHGARTKRRFMDDLIKAPAHCAKLFEDNKSCLSL